MFPENQLNILTENKENQKEMMGGCGSWVQSLTEVDTLDIVLKNVLK